MKVPQKLTFKTRKMTLLMAARFINLFCTGLFTGVLFGTWFGVSPTMLNLTASAYTQIQQSFIRSFDPTMPILATLALVSSIVIMWLLRHDYKTKVFALAVIGFFCFLGALILTFAINVPINIEVLTWSIQSPPDNWMQIRDRWEQANTFRTVVSLLSFVFQLLVFS